MPRLWEDKKRETRQRLPFVLCKWLLRRIQLGSSVLANEYRKRIGVVVVVGINDHLGTVEIQTRSKVLREVSRATGAARPVGADCARVHHAGSRGLRERRNAC